ncbi:glycine N-acyltransferase-like protein 3 isoform X2 [Babylonia areolata]|uniref:glycine N-acyltransferase-like protein 3 isoform X2 n=1 Tax=Babylonia areolata TaxID=304850 RepID=UPI003FD14634
MAVNLPTCHLPELLSWLKKYLPHTFKLHEELKSHLRGQYPQLEFFVDRWPHPQAVLAKVRREHVEQSVVEGVFGVTEGAVGDLLRDPTIALWDTRVVLTAVTKSLKPVLLTVAEEMGKSVTLYTSVLLKATPKDITPASVPDGIKIRSVSSADIKRMNSTWEYSFEGSDTYMQESVRHYPSVYLQTGSGHHVGHMVGTSYGTLGMLYVYPEFRRNGYAKVIVSQLAQKYFDRGEDAYVFVEENNLPSQRLHESLGFRSVYGGGVVWLWCDSKPFPK